MSLSANQQKFAKEVEKTIKQYATDAMKKSFSSAVKEDMSQKEIMEKISKDFGEEFSKCAPELCKIITEHIMQITLTPMLSNSAGPVAGVITLS